MIQSLPFAIESELREESARLTLTGELDLATAPRLGEAVDGVLARGAHTLVIDIAAITFVDSSGLRLLIALSIRAGEEGWTLALTRPAPQARAVFEITGADANLPYIDEAAK